MYFLIIYIYIYIPERTFVGALNAGGGAGALVLLQLPKGQLLL